MPEVMHPVDLREFVVTCKFDFTELFMLGLTCSLHLARDARKNMHQQGLKVQRCVQHMHNDSTYDSCKVLPPTTLVSGSLQNALMLHLLDGDALLSSLYETMSCNIMIDFRVGL